MRPLPRLEDALRSLGRVVPPPPAPALEALVRQSRPVAIRHPLRAFGLVLFVSLLAAAVDALGYGVRGDFVALPKGLFWATALTLLAAFVATLVAALLPRRGSMFADVRLARLLAFAVPILATALAVFARVDAPPATKIFTGAEALQRIEACLFGGLIVSTLPFAMTVLVLLRSPMPLETRWLGAAVGAGQGVIAGLMLHFVCGVGGALHGVLAHAGQTLIGAALGAIIVPTLVRRVGRARA